MNAGPLIVTAVGDIMLGDLPACTGFGVGSMIARHGPTFPFLRSRDGLAGSDLTIGNLEVVLSRFDLQSDPFDSCHLRAQPEAVKGLLWAGIDAVNLANNHIMQHGAGAVDETVALLRANRIAFTGLANAERGLANLTIVERRGLRIGLLGYNFRPDKYRRLPRMDAGGDETRILDDLEAARPHTDLRILSLHWGEEFIDRPSGDQVRMGRRFVEAGAQIVLGHHPHIPQGIEEHRGGVIAYSLGNFVFDLWPERLRRSMILRLRCDDPARITHEVRIATINARWQPELAQGAEADRRGAELRALTALIDPDADATAWHDEVARELTRFRRSVYWHYIASLHRYGARRLAANLRGVLARRLLR